MEVVLLADSQLTRLSEIGNWHLFGWWCHDDRDREGATDRDREGAAVDIRPLWLTELSRM